LRFKSSIIGDVLNIPFRKVQMVKCTVPWRNPVADALAYSAKNGDILRSNRSVNAGELVVDNRYIAPPDLIERMAKRLSINYGISKAGGFSAPPTISTIPMPALMEILEYPDIPEFPHLHGSVLSASIHACDAFVSIIVPEPNVPFSRISITGNNLMVEINDEALAATFDISEMLHLIGNYLGLSAVNFFNVKLVPQPYAKIQEIDDKKRKAFIYWATTKHQIYSLGRYATWRPRLLLDDLVNDIRLIDSWLVGSDYDRAKQR